MDDKVIDVVKINTKKNPTNMMTKTIPMEKFGASPKVKWREGSWERDMLSDKRGEKAR